MMLRLLRRFIDDKPTSTLTSPSQMDNTGTFPPKRGGCFTSVGESSSNVSPMTIYGMFVLETRILGTVQYGRQMR